MLPSRCATPDDGVERRADLVADHREEVRLGLGRLLGLLPRAQQLALVLLAVGGVEDGGADRAAAFPAASFCAAPS